MAILSKKVARNDEIDQAHISELFGIANCTFRANNIFENPEALLECRTHKPRVPYHERYGPALKKLGLYQFAMIKHVKIDSRLITSLVERWRPETNTFHLSVGEVGVTLQDVSCLWGLPITGPPIIGYSDQDNRKLIKEALGIDVNDGMMKKGKRKLGENEEEIFEKSEFRISLKWLRATYQNLPINPTDEQVVQYTRAFVLDMLGSLAFPDKSGDSVPVMYLRFLLNLENPPVYNWGAAVLSCLYRNLCDACGSNTKSIGGALLLLQHWAWARFNIGRPRHVGPVKALGGANPEARPPFAIKWQYYQTYEVSPAHSSLTFYRNEFDSLLESHVNWYPYDDYLDLLPDRVRTEKEMWFARVPLINFWIVTWHYPDRVMRQLGLFQTVPPPEPHHWTELQKLNKIVHAARQKDNWSERHQIYVKEWDNPNIVEETRLYDSREYIQYRQWFQQNCMYTVYIRGQIEFGLDRLLEAPRDSIEELGYVPGGPRIRRLGMRSLQRVKYIIKKLHKRGTKKVCKMLLKSHRLDAEDADQIPEFERVLTEDGLPTDIESIQVDDDDDDDDSGAHDDGDVAGDGGAAQTHGQIHEVTTQDKTSVSLVPIQRNPSLPIIVEIQPQLVPYGPSEEEEEEQ